MSEDSAEHARTPDAAAAVKAIAVAARLTCDRVSLIRHRFICTLMSVHRSDSATRCGNVTRGPGWAWCCHCYSRRSGRNRSKR